MIAPNRILTGAHVLRSDELHVIVGGGEPRPAKLLGADPDLDVAVLEADTGDAPAVAWDPAVVGDVGVGTAVIALADPGGRGLRASLGFVTATGRSFRGPRGRRVRGHGRAFGAAAARLVRAVRWSTPSSGYSV